MTVAIETCKLYILAPTTVHLRLRKKTEKEKLQEYLKVRPTATTKQIQVDKVRVALLSEKRMHEVEDIATQYSNQRHIQYVRSSIDKK